MLEIMVVCELGKSRQFTAIGGVCARIYMEERSTVMCFLAELGFQGRKADSLTVPDITIDWY